MSRVTVCLPALPWPAWKLPGTEVTEDRWVPGGFRSLHELALAAAAAGHDVELRGRVHRSTLRALGEATGLQPRLDPEPREPRRGEIVVVPEGMDSPLAYASVALSEARAILFVLAPPGLFGWPFASGWSRPDPLTVPLDSLARPEHFRAMSELGFELWSNSQALARAARGAGVPCEWLGTGRPTGAPSPPSRRTHDVAIIASNRWAPLAREVIARTNASVLRIEDVDNDRMLALLGTARILLWPSRVEGHARIQCEARRVGTVPVALASNAYADGLDEASGAVVVDTLEEMPAAIEGLLRDPERLATLSDVAMRTAREQSDWPAYVKRVDAALATKTERASREARAAFGREATRLHEAQRAAERALELERARAVTIEARWRDSEVELDRLRSRRIVRLALGIAAALRPLTGPLWRAASGLAMGARASRLRSFRSLGSETPPPPPPQGP